jgi:predicted GIY-YIG superfamily endonuclease
VVPFWVYILRCADGALYTGQTDDLERRIAQHQSGEFAGFTSSRRPVKLVFAQVCASRVEALNFERQIKGWTHKKKVALIRGEWETVSRLAGGRR